MSIYSSIIIQFICKKCKYRFEFEDRLKNCGIRPERCKHFNLKFIKSIDKNKVEYSIYFKCKNCTKHKVITFKFENDKKNDEPISKSYICCGAEVIINGKLFYNSEGRMDVKKEKNKNAKNNFYLSNKNNNFSNNYIINENENFSNFNNQEINNINNNKFWNNPNDLNDITNNNMMMNYGFNINNYNNQFLPINDTNMNMQFQNNSIGFNNNNINNNLMGNYNNNINDMITQMNNLNINNNNNNIYDKFEIKPIKINIQFGPNDNLRFIKEIPLNKTLKEAINEIGKENPLIKKFCENVKDDIVLCEGENIDYTKTIKEINQEADNPLEDDSVIIVPYIKSSNNN